MIKQDYKPRNKNAFQPVWKEYVKNTLWVILLICLITINLDLALDTF